MNIAIFTLILATAIRAGTPLLYGSLGGIISERAGISNLGMEGIMAVGAIAGFLGVMNTNNLWLGILCASIAGGLFSLILAFLSIQCRANQIITGLAIATLGQGFANFLGHSVAGKTPPVTFKTVNIPVLSNIPIIGEVFFKQDVLIYLSFILVILAWLFIYKTRPGLSLRALGENPSVADSMGINVNLSKYVYVTLGGMISAIGGAYLTLAYTPTWLEGIIAGRGWIAIGLIIFALWNPGRLLFGAYFFGGILSLTYYFQAMGINFSPFLLKMLPYILTIIILSFSYIYFKQKKIGPPAALGEIYDREGR